MRTFYFKLNLFTILLLLSPLNVLAKDVGATSQTHEQKIVAFFNSFDSAEIHFTQVDLNSQNRGGVLYIKKPQKLRLEYFTPEHEIILVDENFVIIYNVELDEINYLSNDDVPLDFLTSRDFKFDNHFKLRNSYDDGSAIFVEAELTKNNTKRLFVFKFSTTRFALESLQIVNAGGDYLILNINKFITNHPLSDKIFDIDRKSDD